MHVSVPSRLHGMLLRVAVLSLTVLGTFAVTVILILLPLRLFLHVPLDSSHSLFLGIVCGLIAWLFLAILHIKSESVRLTFDDRQAFQQMVRERLAELGYDVVEQTADRLVSRPNFRSYLLGGRIDVAFGEGSANVTGPKVFVEILRNRLRLNTRIAKIHKTLSNGSINLDRVHKRVQICLRIAGHQWRSVEKQILENLATAGADVICDVEILARSEAGIPELMLEQHIRRWLKEQRICARIIKDPAMWDDARWEGAWLGLDDTETGTRVDDASIQSR